MQLLEDVSCLKSAAIQSQNSIISLHNELFDCKDVQLDSVNSTVTDAVKTTVKTEMKSYSEAVSSNSAPTMRAHVPDVKTLKNVVKEVVQTEDRSRNLIVFGVEEEAHEDTGNKISEILDYIEEKPRQDSVRIGLDSREVRIWWTSSYKSQLCK